MVSVNPIEDVLRIQRVFNAPRAAVFQAWTDPEALKQWWGPEGFSTPSADIDLRVGGRYRLEMRAPDGETAFLIGEYKQVEPPARLVYTWAWEDGSACGDGHEPVKGESLIRVDFVDLGDKTEIILLHEGLPTAQSREEHHHGWSGSFDRLDKLFD